MTIEITIAVPDTLGRQLQQVQDRLPEVLERGLREIESEARAEAHAEPYDEQAIIAVLTSQPTPEQVLALRPSLELQERARQLQARSKEGKLTSQEQTELDRVLLLEHMVRLAKTNAYRRLAQQP